MNVLLIKYFFLMFLIAGLNSRLSAQKLRFLIPDGTIIQHAGSIGYFSVGVNYKLFENQRGSFDLMYGYVPKSRGGGFSTLTTKFAHRPFELKVNEWLALHPVNPGAFLSYTLDKDFDLTWDKNQYPKGYYYWSEALHFHISFSSEARLDTRRLMSTKTIKNLTLYYEVNTNDMYLINYIQNTKAFSLADIFKAGIGIKANFNIP